MYGPEEHLHVSVQYACKKAVNTTPDWTDHMKMILFELKNIIL